MAGSPRIFISVAEESADAHAAALVRIARERIPGVSFFGLTGPALRAAGVETVYDLTSRAAMLSGILGNLRRGREALRAAEQSWDKYRPDLVIVMDSSALHLPMAKRAKRHGLPVLYYIAPQVWASREYRNRQLAERVDRVACILPFEQRYFRRNLVFAEYVGHPLFERLRDEHPNAETVHRLREPGHPVVALLPGSRSQVIDAVLPRQLEVVRRLRAGGQVVTPVVSCTSEHRRAEIRRHIVAGGFAVEILVNDNATLLKAADLVLVASGTATLHVAYYRKPMIVMYDAGRLMRPIHTTFGRQILKTPHLALVNILAGTRVVPEFMPFVPDCRPVAAVARELLTDDQRREIIARRLDEVVRPLETANASERVCRIVERMLAGRGAFRR